MKTLSPLVTSILTPLMVILPVRAAALTFSEPASAAPQQLRITVVDREPGSVPAGSTAAKGFTVLVADQTGAPVADSAVVFRFPDDGPSGSLPDASHSAIVYTSADGIARISGIKWGNMPGPVAIKIMATKGEGRAGILLMEALTAPSAADAPALQPVPQPAPALVHQSQPQQQPAVPAAHVAPAKAPTSESITTVDKTALQMPQEPRPSIAEPPAVSVTNGKTASTGYHSSHKKWIILAAVVAAAAGAGVAVGAKGKSSSSSSTSGVSVGTPTVSVGQP